MLLAIKDDSVLLIKKMNNWFTHSAIAPFALPNCTGFRFRLLYTRATSHSRERYVKLSNDTTSF